MFTLEQVNDIHDRFGSAETLSDYLSALNAIGVDSYDSFIADGHSEYVGMNGHKVVFEPLYDKLDVANTSSHEILMHHLNQHQEQKSDYFEMTRGLAESGIEKWTFDTNAMTVSYVDSIGNALLVESIE